MHLHEPFIPKSVGEGPACDLHLAGTRLEAEAMDSGWFGELFLQAEI